MLEHVAEQDPVARARERRAEGGILDVALDDLDAARPRGGRRLGVRLHAHDLAAPRACSSAAR